MSRYFFAPGKSTLHAQFLSMDFGDLERRVAALLEPVDINSREVTTAEPVLYGKPGWTIIDDIGPNIVEQYHKLMLPKIEQPPQPQLKYHERFQLGRVPNKRRKR